MELPSIGKHCAFEACKQLDYLPLQCKCGQIFCSEHFKLHTDFCETSKHLSEDELKKIQNVFGCSHSGCHERSILPLICQKCGKHFCVKHRHVVQCEEKDAESLAQEKERYAEPIRRFNEAKEAVDKQVDSKISNSKKKEKTREMAIKVQLMKIKNKATGLKSIPTVNRVYFSVAYTKHQEEKCLPVFVSNQWTVGRAIDAIAEELKMPNNNNKGSEKKLRLFKRDGGEIISKNVSVAMGSLLDDSILVDGDNLVIEYVEDGCEKL